VPEGAAAVVLRAGRRPGRWKWYVADARTGQPTGVGGPETVKATLAAREWLVHWDGDRAEVVPAGEEAPCPAPPGPESADSREEG
jgi:hypothetical protein